MIKEKIAEMEKEIRDYEFQFADMGMSHKTNKNINVIKIREKLIGYKKALEDVRALIEKSIKEAKEKHKEQFDNEAILKVGYHSKIWKVPKWLFSGTREGVLKEILEEIGK